MINIGLIGFGFAAQTFHLPLILANQDLAITAVSSSNEKKVFEVLSDVEVFANAEQLIVESSVDLVVITAPNDVHFSLAKLALENNKHVVIEKPMTTTTEEAMALIELAERKKLKLTVFHNRRWDGDFLTIKSLIDENKVGKVKVFESHFDRFRPEVRNRWREQPGEGTGIWYDLGPHLVDQALQLFGLPKAVVGQCLATRAGSQVCDYFHVTLGYDDKQVILCSSPFQAGRNIRFQLQGESGAYIKYGLDPQEQQLKDGVEVNGPQFGRENESDYGVLTCQVNDLTPEPVTTSVGDYAAFYRELASAISNDTPVPVPPREIVDVMRVLSLAQQSSDEGRKLSFE